MARVIVPQDATPGDLTQVVGGPTMCDIGPTRDNPGGGWVQVTIQPVGNVATDAAGRFLHCLWTFARSRMAFGRRRELVPGYQPPGVKPSDAIQVETDPGWFWVGSGAMIGFLGGTPGDEYDVTVEASTPYDTDIPLSAIEPPFRFSLTSYFVVPAVEPTPTGFAPFPAIPQYHSWFQVVAGAARVSNGTGTITLNPGAKIPADVAGIQVSTGVFRTRGAF